MSDAAAKVEAARKALAEAEAALAAERTGTTIQAAPRDAVAGDAALEAPATAGGPLTAEQVAQVRDGYAFEGAALELGALVNGEVLADVPVRIPIAMLNRHGLVAGATGTGKTRTLQVMAEQLSAAGVPVFAADIKGDLGGVSVPGQPNDKLLARCASIGQDWVASASPTEFFSLGGQGTGVPLRATVSSFGPLLMSKVLGLNATQESSLGLVFHYADSAGLALVDLPDLRAVLSYLVSDDGKAELAGVGGLAKATVGVILRQLVGFADQGADVFFGEPEFDTGEFLRTATDGRGIISLLEVPGVQGQPALYSTFLMWLLADLFNDLPEVGDLDKPKLVFFFDEAHLLFNDASKDFLQSITQTVRLIRSKGVGIVFVTQTPKDIPNEVLAQVGSRVQHQLRAHTPDDAKALRATVSTYPTSGYDLGEVLTSLATGEAIVTVMNETGAPSPVAWTRLRAPQGSMAPAPADVVAAGIAASPLLPRYGMPVDRESAREILTARMNAAAAAADYERSQREFEKAEEAERTRAERTRQKAPAPRRPTSTRTPVTRRQKSPLEDILGSSTGKAVVREVLRGIFGTLKRR
ncbi:MAG: hypothetical protein JWQ43_2322 [Glaciihabitans sp.]|nr:hypothetical protein [Glaciihabitans sp.]